MKRLQNSSHIELTYRDHVLFRQIFQVDSYHNNGEHLDYCIDWFNSQVEPNYYQINFNIRNGSIEGYRYGDLVFGQIE